MLELRPTTPQDYPEWSGFARPREREWVTGGGSGPRDKSGEPTHAHLRQWRGHTHAVLVRDDGFEYEGQPYRSLSVIAKRITGAHWSGPRFFGLIKRATASAVAGAG